MLNLTKIFYTAYRLFPFILVSFFTLSSLLNQDIKGIIYLAGLLIACFVSTIVGSTFPNFFKNISTTSTSSAPATATATASASASAAASAATTAPESIDFNLICNSLTLGEDGPISKLPLSMTVYSFTFFYLVYIIGKYKLANQNIITILFFSTVILGDWYWHRLFNCNSHSSLFGAFAIGTIIGLAWSAIIASTGKVELQYFNGISNKEVCKLRAKQKFLCRSKTSS
jgi:hypothetical protein